MVAGFLYFYICFLSNSLFLFLSFSSKKRETKTFVVTFCRAGGQYKLLLPFSLIFHKLIYCFKFLIFFVVMMHTSMYKVCEIHMYVYNMYVYVRRFTFPVLFLASSFIFRTVLSLLSLLSCL